MRFLFLLVLLLALLALALFIAGQLGLLRGKAPTDLGLSEGKLKRISRTENSVSSQADLWPDHPMRDYARIAPIRYSSDGAAAMKKLAGIVRSLPRTEVVREEPSYLYAQCTTALLKFTDDLEFALDETAKVIHVRSSSRVGRKDFGVNRARVEAIRQQMGA
jgi:uncharacterized protein (DUF1499 family)